MNARVACWKKQLHEYTTEPPIFLGTGSRLTGSDQIPKDEPKEAVNGYRESQDMEVSSGQSTGHAQRYCW